MKWFLLYVAICGVSATPKSEIFRLLRNKETKSEMAKAKLDRATVWKHYVGYCHESSAWCYNDETHGPDFINTLFSQIDRCHVGPQTADDDSLCITGCWYGVERIRRCGSDPPTSKRSLFGDMGAGLMTITKVVFEMLDLDGLARKKFNFFEFFTVDVSETTWDRAYYFLEFYCPYLPLFVLYLFSHKASLSRGLFGIGAFLMVCIIVRIQERGIIPILYAIGPCTFLLPGTDTMGLFMRELYLGFGLATVCGLFTIFVENWFVRLSIQLCVLMSMIWLIYDAVTKRKSSDGIPTTLMRTFNILLLFDLCMHVIVKQELFADTYSHLEWYVLVVFGFSHESGGLLNHLCVFFDKFDVAADGFMSKAFGTNWFNALPLEENYTVVLVYGSYLLTFVIRTFYGYLPVLYRQGWSGLSIAWVFKAFVFSHSSFLRSILFIYNQTFGERVTGGTYYYGYFEILLVLVQCWSAQEVLVLNITISMLLHLCFRRNHWIHHLANLLTYETVAGTGLSQKQIDRALNSCHAVKFFNADDWNDKQVSFLNNRDWSCFNGAVDRAFVFMNSFTSAFPVNGATPWIALGSYTSTFSSHLNIQLGGIDENGFKVIRGTASGGYVQHNGMSGISTAWHCIVSGISYITIRRGNESLLIEFDVDEIYHFAPTNPGGDIYDYVVFIPLSPEMVAKMHTTFPSLIISPFEFFSGPIEEIVGIIVVGGDKYPIVNTPQVWGFELNMARLFVNLMHGDSGSLIYGVNPDGLLFILGTVSRGFNSLNEASIGTCVNGCDFIEGPPQAAESMLMLLLKDSCLLTAVSAEFRRRMRDLLLTSPPVVDTDLETAVLTEDAPPVAVSSELMRLPKSNVDEWLVAVISKLDQEELAMNKWHECPDPDAHGERYDDDGDKSLGDNDCDIPEYGGHRGKAGKRQKNRNKNRAAEKRNPFSEKFEVVRIDPKSEYVQQCVRLCDVQRRKDSDLRTIWKGLVSRYGLLRPWDQAYRDGAVIAFNRARGGGIKQLGN